MESEKITPEYLEQLSLKELYGLKDDAFCKMVSDPECKEEYSLSEASHH